jgi:hypothetical protein
VNRFGIVGAAFIVLGTVPDGPANDVGTDWRLRVGCAFSRASPSWWVQASSDSRVTLTVHERPPVNRDLTASEQSRLLELLKGLPKQRSLFEFGLVYAVDGVDCAASLKSRGQEWTWVLGTWEAETACTPEIAAAVRIVLFARSLIPSRSAIRPADGYSSCAEVVP